MYFLRYIFTYCCMFSLFLPMLVAMRPSFLQQEVQASCGSALLAVEVRDHEMCVVSHEKLYSFAGVEPPAPSSHALDGLASMGFPRALCEAALRKSRGNADAAAELLFNGYSGEPEPAPVSAVPGAKDGNDGHDWRCEECTFLNIR